MKHKIFRIVKQSLVAQAIIVSFVSLTIVFPDVLFRGAAFSVTDNLNAGSYGGQEALFYPKFSYREWWQSYADNGGSYFQSEPMMEFVKNTLWNKDSPYWNPYSGLGSMGPEALVDIKFSPQTMIYAIFGGGSRVFNGSLLFLYFWAVFFLYLTLRKYLKLSFCASLAGIFFYLLNGFSSANTPSNVYQSFLFLPMSLFALFSIIEKPSTGRIVLFIFSYSLLLMCTFMPTTIIATVAIGVITGAYLFQKIINKELNVTHAISLVIRFFGSAFASFLMVAPIYFPILENVQASGTLETYGQRLFNPANPKSILSLFSPMHFFENYNAVGIFDRFRFDLAGETIFHIGITSFFAICFSWYRNRQKDYFIRILMLVVLLVLLRIFNFPFLSILFNHIPVIGNIGSQYWWPLVMMPLALLVGIGIDTVKKQAKLSRLNIFALIVISAATVNTGYFYFKQAVVFNNFKILALVIFVLLIVSSFVLIVFSTRKTYIYLAILVMGELLFSTKQLRYKIVDYYNFPPAEVSFIQNNIDNHRIIALDHVHLAPEQGSAFGIQQFTTNSTGSTPELWPFFNKTFRLKKDQIFFTLPTLRAIKDTPEDNIIDDELLDFAGVKYIVAPATYTRYRDYFLDAGFVSAYQDSTVNIFENLDVWPRAFLVTDDNIQITEDNEIDLISLNKEYVIPVSINSYRNTTISLSGSASQSAYLVITDAWHPKWTAKVNNEPKDMVKVNDMFRAVRVEPGEFTVKMDYELKSLPIALIITPSVIFLLLTALTFNSRIDKFLSQRFK